MSNSRKVAASVLAILMLGLTACSEDCNTDPAGLTKEQRAERTKEYEKAFGTPAPTLPVQEC